ncbi:MAG: EAL domain-containing protein [Gammaproteobacteria bacterium]|nr:EAL domain-containing protein [Gammaproteobacteria bacterium]
MKLRFTICTFISMALALLSMATAAATNGAAEAPFRFYTVLDGLTQSNVVDIEQDQAGYLWFTTARGLNRFDGKDFDQFTIADGLPHNSLTALHITAENSVWVGDARGGITAIHGGRVIHIVEPLEGMVKPVLDIEFVDSRKFAVVEGVGIIEITKEDHGYSASYLVGDESTGITNLAVRGSDVWAESTTGLYKFEFDGEPRLTAISESVATIHVDSTGLLWVADTAGKIGVWRAGGFEQRATVESDNDIVSIATDREGLVWVATANELFSFDRGGQAIDSSMAEIKQYSGIDEVTSIFVDRENSVWLSSGSRLIRFLGDRFRHFRLLSEFDSETVWAISEDRHGRFWFGTDSELLLRQHDESLVIVGEDFGIPDGAIRDVVSDGQDSLWIGMTAHGLYHFDVDAMVATHIAESHDADILDVTIAADGSVWYSTIGSGVFRYQPGEKVLTRFKAPDGTSVYSLDTWSDGSVWYGADEVGLVRLLPNNRGGFDQQIFGGDGAAEQSQDESVVLAVSGEGGYDEEIPGPSDSLSNRLFNHISLTGSDSAWIATEEGGLFHFTSGGFVEYGDTTPLADQTVYLVEPLDNGTLVVGGEQGLYQFTPGESGITHYNQQVGFIGLETNVHATHIDSSDHLWIGTVDGAARMDTSQGMPPAFEPTPTIVRVETQLDGRQILDSQEIEPSQLGAHVEFAAISLLNPRGMQYSYRLEGADNEWGSPTSSRVVSYPRIPPGSYEFLVRARYPGGDWSSSVASHRFTVLPFFWQQPWFVFFSLVAVLIALRAFMAYRTRKIEWLNDTLRAQVEERTESIEKARQELLTSNALLSQEIEARAEVETRFLNAFENAPIGMSLLDAEGTLLDANPVLRNMFWPALINRKFADAVGDDDRDRFVDLYERLVSAELDSIHEKMVCIGPAGEELQALINLSVVRSDAGEFLYSVLQVQDVTESMQLTVQLEYQASYDELTGLLNRRAFEAQLEGAWALGVERDKTSYLMFMDLDQFKVVNDTSGHTAGDQLLQSVSEILLHSVRDDDIVGRLGGDEFGIILRECPTDVAKRIAESIRESVENFRFHWDVETYRIGVSIGGVPIDAQIGDISELQQLADAACYAAKEAGRNRVHMVSGEKDSARMHRGQVRWVQRLREAMDKNRFAIYCQEIKPINGAPAEPEQLEILLRLRDPETRRLVPPGAFLPAAERYGLSVELDKWVITSLFNMLFVHHAFEAAERKYWINLSGNSVGDRRFAEFLKDAVKKSPLPPGTINFDITETAVIRNISEARELMASLQEMGCQFALDDFGSGLSSFSYLKTLPVDYVKIDGMFIRDLIRDRTDRIFVKSIIDIAHALDIKTVAELVEDDEALPAVRELGADYAQGFAVGKPFILAPRFPQTVGSELGRADDHAQAG